MSLRTRTLSAAAIGACLVGLTACGAATTPAAPAAPASAAAAPATATGTLDAADQTSDGKSVTVSAVDIEAGGMGGWIALHQDMGGKPGPVKYWVAVPAGKSTNVMIPTSGGITTGAYWPMLHVDDHVIGTYEFPQTAGADLPAKADAMIVMKKIQVTVG